MKVGHVTVLADFGALMERNADGYHVRPEGELPYKIDLIRRAQDLALNDTRYQPVRKHLDAAINDLENYLSDEDLAPYLSAVDAYGLFMRTLASSEYRRLLASNREAALAITAAGIPEGTFERLAPLERLLRRRRALRWSDLRTRMPHLFDDDANESAFEHWMFSHAEDAFVVASEARSQLRLTEPGQPARERAALVFRARLNELAQLRDEALTYGPIPAGAAERSEIYQSVLVHVTGSLHDVTRAQLDGRHADVAEAQTRFEEMLAILSRMKAQNEESRAALTARILQGAYDQPASSAAGRPVASTTRDDDRHASTWEPKGRIEDIDDGGDGA